MPQLSPLNWALLSLFILMMIFMVKVFFSYMTTKKLSFLASNQKSGAKNFAKWNW